MWSGLSDHSAAVNYRRRAKTGGQDIKIDRTSNAVGIIQSNQTCHTTTVERFRRLDAEGARRVPPYLRLT